MAKRKLTRKEKLRILRRTIVLPYLGVALLVVPLALVTKWNSRVKVDVKVRQISFDFERSPTGVIVNPSVYQSAHIVHESTSVVRDSATDKETIKISVGHDGSLTIDKPRLDELNINPGSRVTLERDDPSSLAVRIRGGKTSAQLTVPASTAVQCEICEVDGARAEVVRYSTALPGDSVITVDAPQRMHMVLQTDAAPVIAENMEIGDPAFLAGSAASLSSSLVDDGVVTLRDVEGATIPVLRSEVFSFEKPQEFVIERISAAPEGLHVVMTGRSSQLRTGRPGAMRDRYPSLLYRLHANQKLALYFGAVIWVAGTLLSVLRQLRFIDQEK